ncbi:hypothetical protein KA005_06690 [bacterium]|nr:hypothetical protein [bacterium]
MFKKEKIITCVLLIAGVMFCLNSAWALSIGESDITAQSTAEAANSSGRFVGVYSDWIPVFGREENLDTFEDGFEVEIDCMRDILDPDAWKTMNSERTIISPEIIFQTAPSLAEIVRIGCQDKQDTAALQDKVSVQIEAIVPTELPEDIMVERELIVGSIVSYIVDDLSPFSAKMDDVALYSSVVSILGLDIPVSLEISSESKTLEDGMALITALKEELKITEVNFLLNEEVSSYSVVVAGEGESDVILDIADFADVKHIKAKAILTTKHGDYQLERRDNKFILTEPDYFDSGSGDLESEPVSILRDRKLEFSSLRYVEEYRSLVDSMEDYGESSKVSASAFRSIGTVPDAQLEVRLTGGEYEEELKEIGAVIDYVDQDEFVYKITVSPNKILDLIGLDFVKYVDVYLGEE